MLEFQWVAESIELQIDLQRIRSLRHGPVDSRFCVGHMGDGVKVSLRSRATGHEELAEEYDEHGEREAPVPAQHDGLLSCLVDPW
jgi:hypothetical protein